MPKLLEPENEWQFRVFNLSGTICLFVFLLVKWNYLFMGHKQRNFLISHNSATNKVQEYGTSGLHTPDSSQQGPQHATAIGLY